MANRRLTRHLVDFLDPGRSVREIRDTELRGFGVRILPSGRKRHFAHTQSNGERVWTSISDADMLHVADRLGFGPAAAGSAAEGQAILFGGGFGRNSVRRCRGGFFPPSRPKPETGRACGQSSLPEETDPTPDSGATGRRHQAPMRPAMIRFSPLDCRSRRPREAGSVGDYAGSRNPRVPTGRQRRSNRCSSTPASSSAVSKAGLRSSAAPFPGCRKIRHVGAADVNLGLDPAAPGDGEYARPVEAL